MTHPKHHIALTEQEAELASKIDTRYPLPRGADARVIYLANRQPILDLLRSLAERDGIPANRVAYWTEADHKPGRTKGSREELYRRHGNSVEESLTHPNFMPILRYFLYGADLPSDAIDDFETQVGNPEWFGGSDIIPLTKKTREIVRRYGLTDYSHADEFHKLALDNGLNVYHAEAVRKAARDAARR